MSRTTRTLMAVLAVVAPSSLTASQQHGGSDAHDSTAMRPMVGPLGIPMSREASGTAWLPDSTPMHAIHAAAGSWLLMVHGNVFVQYVRETSDRGDEQFGSINWVMGMARTPAAGGVLTVRTTFSAEPATVGRCGYPDLLATGEFCRGEPLHDRQHPHDVFMELAAGYERQVTSGLAIQLYGGPVGEPALGPGGYPHRASAQANPIAPIGHHWMDATHISFGVVTAGLFGRWWKVEGSVFNGREPDDQRTGIDLDALDSYAARVWLVPGPRWAIQASAGRLEEAEPARGPEPARDVTRVTASATYHAPLAGGVATTLVWGHNIEADRGTDAAMIETNWTLTRHDAAFASLEGARKTGEDLALGDSTLQDEMFTVFRAALGYERRLGPMGGFLPGLGARLAVSLVPAGLQPFYGRRASLGLAVFATLRPAPMGPMGAAPDRMH